MTTLNNYLNHLFETKVIKKSDFKKKLFLTDRQLNYFLKTGAPIPDNFLYLLNKNFNLSSEEFAKTLEAYEVSMYGESIASNKKSIHKLLTNFNEFYNYSTLKKSQVPNFPELTSISIDLINFLDKLLSNCNTLSSKIQLSTIQGKAVSELVQYIISELHKSEKNHVQIDHIFKYKNLKEHSDMTHNLTFLNDITSLIASYENYNPYFYTVSYTQEYNYSIYPNTLLICDTLIYISEDFKTWFYINEEKEKNIDKIISLYNNEFEKSKSHTKPFIRTMKDLVSFQEFVIKIEIESAIEYGFRRDMPCLSPPPNMSIEWFEYDRNIVNEYSLTILSKLHNDRSSNFEKKLAEGFRMSVVCSEDFTSNFFNTGRIYDQGEYPTFNINARVTIISNLLKQLNENPLFNIHLIKEGMLELFPFIDKVQLCTNDSNVMISITDENLEICEKQPFVFAVLLDSPEISNCFNQYIDTIKKTMTYSRDDSILIIKKALEDFALENNIKISDNLT